MPGTVKSELLPDADRSHKCDCQEKFEKMLNLLLDKSHFITVERNEQLKQIGAVINNRLEEYEKVQRYNEIVDNYCRNTGITLYQYEKQCFWAERGYNDYPEPERYNPEKQIDKEVTVNKEHELEPQRER